MRGHANIFLRKTSCSVDLRCLFCCVFKTFFSEFHTSDFQEIPTRRFFSHKTHGKTRQTKWRSIMVKWMKDLKVKSFTCFCPHQNSTNISTKKVQTFQIIFLRNSLGISDIYLRLHFIVSLGVVCCDSIFIFSAVSTIR